MKPVILAASPLHPLYVQALQQDHDLIGPMDLAALAAHPARPHIQILAASGESRVSAALIDALPALRLIPVMGVGYDGVDVAHARSKGVVVTHTPDVLNDDVADLAMGLMLGVTRRLVHADAHVRSGSWAKGPLPLATKLSGLRLGLVGMGRIGQAIAHRALAFGMPVAYTARQPRPHLPYTYHPDATSLAAASDVLCVITPGGAATRHLINAQVLQALGPRGFLVNVARGSVVDEAALVQALQAGQIAGAGLDVFENEPHPHPDLLAMPQVMLTPHVGSATQATRQAMVDLAMDNIHRYENHQALATPVPECRT